MGSLANGGLIPDTVHSPVVAPRPIAVVTSTYPTIARVKRDYSRIHSTSTDSSIARLGVPMLALAKQDLNSTHTTKFALKQLKHQKSKNSLPEIIKGPLLSV